MNWGPSMRFLGIAAVLAAALPLPTLAATDTGQLQVTATVATGCAIGGGTLAFGEDQSGQSGNLDVDGSITYSNCNGELLFELDGGQSNDVNARAMTSGGNSLTYQIYRNSTRDLIAGEGTANDIGILLFVEQSGSVSIYGRIPGGQSVAAGSYSDTVNITMTF